LRLPAPYPGELIDSVLSRGVIHTGLAPKRLLYRLVGNKRSGHSFLLPPSLKHLAEEMGIEPVHLLWRHTVFPFTVAFMAQRKSCARTKNIDQAAHKTRSLGSLARSVSRGLPSLRYCPHCAHEDLQEFGESYWHRAHCLPCVHWCLQHGSPLHLPEAPTRSFSRLLCAPLPHRQSGSADLPSIPFWAVYWMSEKAHELLSRRRTYRDDWLEVYRVRAAQKGFVLAGGSIAGARMAYELRALFGPRYLAQLCCDYEQFVQAWPALMVRERIGISFAPVKHLLLGAFLEHNGSQPGTFQYAVPGKKPLNRIVLDSRLAIQVREATLAATRLGDRTTVRALMQSTGHWSVFRHDRKSFPLTVRRWSSSRPRGDRTQIGGACCTQAKNGTTHAARRAPDGKETKKSNGDSSTGMPSPPRSNLAAVPQIDSNAG